MSASNIKAEWSKAGTAKAFHADASFNGFPGFSRIGVLNSNRTKARVGEVNSGEKPFDGRLLNVFSIWYVDMSGKVLRSKGVWLESAPLPNIRMRRSTSAGWIFKVPLIKDLETRSEMRLRCCGDLLQR